MMGSVMGSSRRVFAWVAAFAFGLLAPGVSLASESERTRAQMTRIFEAMQPLLLFALDDESFAKSGNRAEIASALALLEESSADLAAHGRERGPSFAHLGAALASDAQEAHRRWNERDPETARFLVLQLTETCVACHSRLRSDRDSPLSQRFVDENTVRGLPLDQRALIQYATRQFSRALESYEALLADSRHHASDIDRMGHLDEYLEICIRVRHEPTRAVEVLKRFAERSDTSRVLRGQVSRWIEALKAPGPPGDAGLGEIERMIAEARQPYPGTSDRDGLVDYLQAGALLHQQLEEGFVEPEERARALYLLGLIDTRIGRTFWLSQSETYLEASIRTAPSTNTAQRSYELLEEFLILGYTGSSGQNVPADVQQKLEELRALASIPGNRSP